MVFVLGDFYNLVRRKVIKCIRMVSINRLVIFGFILFWFFGVFFAYMVGVYREL